MKSGEKREFLFLESVGFISAGKAKEEFLQNLKEAAKVYKNENDQMRLFLEQKYPDKRIVKNGLNWHVID
jgi:hypothetical protein